jgi:hypothetical protein
LRIPGANTHKSGIMVSKYAIHLAGAQTPVKKMLSSCATMQLEKSPLLGSNGRGVGSLPCERQRNADLDFSQRTSYVSELASEGLEECSDSSEELKLDPEERKETVQPLI